MTFTSNGTGGGTSGSVTVHVERFGSFVIARIPDFSAASGTGSPDRYTASVALPSWALPSLARSSQSGTTRNNGANSGDLSYWSISTGGILLMFRNSVGSLFTVSSSCGLNTEAVITWQV